MAAFAVQYVPLAIDVFVMANASRMVWAAVLDFEATHPSMAM
jgi:hypothetical protein